MFNSEQKPIDQQVQIKKSTNSYAYIIFNKGPFI